MNKYLDLAMPYLPAALITILTIRSVIAGSGIGDAISIIALSALYGYKLYLNTKATVDINAEVIKEVEKIKGEVSQVSMAISQRPQQKPVSFRF